MITIWLIKLILSHLLTDFFLQTKKWIDNRIEKHFLSPYLYLHGIITAVVALLFMGFSYWLYAVVIFVTHTIIDGWKSYKTPTIKFFLIDQLLHLLVILGCWYFAFFNPQDLRVLWQTIGKDDHFWIILTAFTFLSFPAGMIIGHMTKKWSDQLPGGVGLANAGKWIGILERMIILIFLLQNQYAAIGLLITAKGLLRFSEKDRQEEKTEYVLIGSLISVAFSIITGIITNYMLAR